jgi:Icc-related predicted phosphoesterase
MIRIAAAGDLHVGADMAGAYRGRLGQLAGQADVFLVAGDLTRHGTVEEGRVAAGELRDLGLPVIAVLGNHDYHSDREDEIADVLRDAGVGVLEGDGTVVECGAARLGVAGGKGFGGGFEGKCASDFGEPEMKAFIRHTK